METLNVWELKRGERFRLSPVIHADDDVYIFNHMDGMYCFARRESDGEIMTWSGPVERVP